jgi:hypothetical protein
MFLLFCLNIVNLSNFVWKKVLTYVLYLLKLKKALQSSVYNVNCHYLYKSASIFLTFVVGFAADYIKNSTGIA